MNINTVEVNHTISVNSWVFSPPKDARTCHKVQYPTMPTCHWKNWIHVESVHIDILVLKPAIARIACAYKVVKYWLASLQCQESDA